MVLLQHDTQKSIDALSSAFESGENPRELSQFCMTLERGGDLSWFKQHNLVIFRYN